MDMLSVGLILEGDLLETALSTAVIEVVVLYLLGYRSRKILSWFFATNIVSNILFNEFLMTDFLPELYANIFVGECLVLILEYCMMLYVVSARKSRLLFSLLVNNGASFVVGLLYINGGMIQ
jgi:hypothetical protein